jgi:hypothetical protein
VNEWYKIEPITNEGDVRTRLSSKEGTFNNKEAHRGSWLSHTPGSAQRPRKQLSENIAVKKRKLTESSEVIKARKTRKLQEKAEAKKKREKPKSRRRRLQ